MEFFLSLRLGEGSDVIFHVQVTIDGNIYRGEGTSKQRAKLDLATKAIKQLNLNQPTAEDIEAESQAKRLKTGPQPGYIPVPFGLPISRQVSEKSIPFDWQFYNQRYKGKKIYA